MLWVVIEQRPRVKYTLSNPVTASVSSDVKRQKNGAEAMSNENAEAYRQAHQGKAAMKEHAFALATQHYQRALGIFHSVSNDSGERQCLWDIASVDLKRQIEEERKDLSPRQDALN
jgi:hypothetical protein